MCHCRRHSHRRSRRAPTSRCGRHPRRAQRGRVRRPDPDQPPTEGRHMKLRKTLAAISAAADAVSMTACGGTGSSGSGGGETLTVYSADGLATWYKGQFDKFTKDTGIKVDLVEAGSGEVVSR